MKARFFAMALSLLLAEVTGAAGEDVSPQVRSRTQPQVAPGTIPSEQSKRRTIDVAFPLVSVTSPKAGQSVPLDGKVVQIPFTVKNLDPYKGYEFLSELVRNGTTLGCAGTAGCATLTVNVLDGTTHYGLTSGLYSAGGIVQLATPGAGYQYRITIYEGPLQNGKIVAKGLSGSFSFGDKQAPTAASQVSVINPKAGQIVLLDGYTLSVPFTVTNMDPYKGYEFVPELLRNGRVLGCAGSTGCLGSSLNSLNTGPTYWGVKSGIYAADNIVQLAAPGTGYQYQITVYEGPWTNGKVVARGLSGSFTYKAKN